MPSFELSSCCDPAHCRASSCRVDLDERSGEYSCIFLPELAGRTSIKLQGELGRPLGTLGRGRGTPPAHLPTQQGHSLGTGRECLAWSPL